ncbi:hypothetical protein [Bailinhaonella thermotolerans]|nr:hypothetical protein [Bailinhaonella thermotolerans]
MTVWLVAEDVTQLLRADQVVTLAAQPADLPERPESRAHPTNRLRHAEWARIMAGSGTGPEADGGHVCLLTLPGRHAVPALSALAATLARAEKATPPGESAFVHGPLPSWAAEGPRPDPIWHIAPEPPAAWPRRNPAHGRARVTWGMGPVSDAEVREAAWRVAARLPQLDSRLDVENAVPEIEEFLAEARSDRGEFDLRLRALKLREMVGGSRAGQGIAAYSLVLDARSILGLLAESGPVRRRAGRDR